MSQYILDYTGAKVNEILGTAESLPSTVDELSETVNGLSSTSDDLSTRVVDLEDAWDSISQMRDYIVDEGKSGSWRYVKYANGNALLSITSEYIGAIASTYNGSSYKGTGKTLSYPFTVTDAIIASCFTGNWQVTSIFATTDPAGASFTWFPIASSANSSTSLSTTAQFIIWGYWK